jgi:CubicO group peptidase (beta-lactamase class C family)
VFVTGDPDKDRRNIMKTFIGSTSRRIPGSVTVYFAVLFTLASFVAGGLSQTTEYRYRPPEKYDDGWEVSSLQAEGIAAGPIEEVSGQIRDRDAIDHVLSLLIVKNGKLVHEVYSPYCQRNTLYVLASITKTVTSTLIGIAIDRGLIESVDTKVYTLIPEFAELIRDPAFKNISLKHIMTMTSGLDWNERVSYNDPRNDEFQMVESDNWINYVLSKPVAEPPGTRYNYNTGSIHLLSAVLKSVSGMHAHQFAEKHLLHPMGIYGYQWNKDPMGYPCTGGTDGGIGLRTRDVAKFGWLFLRDGTWNGRRIVSEQWIQEAPRNYTELSGSRKYAYNWFSGAMTVSGKRFEYIATLGYGGQTLYIVPEYDLILVITCALAESGPNWNLVKKVFEAVVQGG